jgi:GTP 3',8-cyclase
MNDDVDFPVARVLDGIDAAAAAGLEQQILPMARRFKDSGHILHFIEHMDVGHADGWRMDDVVPSAEVIRVMGRKLPLAPIEPNYAGKVAERWRYLPVDGDSAGEIGVISSVTEAFCSDRTRARLATGGELYACPFATDGYDLRSRSWRREQRRDRQLCCCDLVAARRPLRGNPFGQHASVAEDRDQLFRRLSGANRSCS